MQSLTAISRCTVGGLVSSSKCVYTCTTSLSSLHATQQWGTLQPRGPANSQQRTRKVQTKRRARTRALDVPKRCCVLLGHKAAPQRDAEFAQARVQPRDRQQARRGRHQALEVQLVQRGQARQRLAQACARNSNTIQRTDGDQLAAGHAITVPSGERSEPFHPTSVSDRSRAQGRSARIRRSKPGCRLLSAFGDVKCRLVSTLGQPAVHPTKSPR